MDTTISKSVVEEEKMNKDTLKQLGIEDEALIQKIIVEHGKSTERIRTEGETMKAELAGLQTQLADANAQIASFKEMDIEGVKKSADEWRTKAEKAQIEAATQIKQMKFDHALEVSLADAKAKSVKAVRALLELDKLSLGDDGKISGLKEQLETVKTANEYLFDGEQLPPKVVKGTGETKTLVNDPIVIAARKAAGISTE